MLLALSPPDRLHSATPAAATAAAKQDPKPGAGRRPRLYVLDGLRLIAALGVVAFHWTGVDRHPYVWGTTPRQLFPALHRFGSYGWLGVQLFFLISGFVICMSCWGKSPREYFTSRVVRLYPAYWVGVLMTTLVVNFAVGVRPDRKPMSLSETFTNLTMLERPLGITEADGVYWTLWIEMRFYLLFAVLAVMGLTYRRVVAFCGIWTILAVFAGYSRDNTLELIFQPQDAPYFIAGVAMYLIYRFGVNPLLLGIVGFSWLIAQDRIRETAGSYEYEVQHTLSWPVLATVTAVVFAVMLAVALGWFDWVRWKRLTVAGALTYPLYLLHQEIGWVLIHLGRQMHIRPKPLLLICLAILLTLAWLVHRFAEKPLSRVVKRLLDRPSMKLPKADPPMHSRFSVSSAHTAGVASGGGDDRSGK